MQPRERSRELKEREYDFVKWNMGCTAVFFIFTVATCIVCYSKIWAAGLCFKGFVCLHYPMGCSKNSKTATRNKRKKSYGYIFNTKVQEKAYT